MTIEHQKNTLFTHAKKLVVDDAISKFKNQTS